MKQNREKIVVPFGCGVNSVAMVIELVKRGLPIDFIVFANTGGYSNLGEKAETYRYKRFFSAWLKSKGYPKIKTVQYNKEGLYKELIRLKTLPSVAFGWKTCSQKWKIQAADKYLKSVGAAINIIKYIGYDAGESHRVKDYSKDGVKFWYPLVEWGLDRMDCVKVIIDSGLPLPPKSSCFFCPNMSKGEIHKLKETDPCRIDKAIELEKNAQDRLETIRGLGRTKKWSEILTETILDFNQEVDYLELEKMPCTCSL